MPSFSQRLGLDLPDAEIVVRHDAPDWLRDIVIVFAYEAGFKPSDLRAVLCRQLIESPDQGNWSEYPNIDGEVHDLIGKAPWFCVYDLIEALYASRAAISIALTSQGQTAEAFAASINRVFRKKGVGWQLTNGHLQVRGPEIFEQTLQTAAELASNSGRDVARRELRESLHDLSRRPEPELTGSIQHAMAALECVARDVTGQENLTLGEWLKRNPQAFPLPLTAAVEKLWGYASEYGRHLREGRAPSFEDAEMLVGISGSLTIYLMRKS